MNPKYRYEYELWYRYVHTDLRAHNPRPIVGFWVRLYRSRSYDNILAKQTVALLNGPTQWNGYHTKMEFQIRAIERKRSIK